MTPAWTCSALCAKYFVF